MNDLSACLTAARDTTHTDELEPSHVAVPVPSFDRIAPRACTLTAFLLPLKLSLTYCALVPLILGYLVLRREQLWRFLRNPATKQVSVPLIIFLCLALLSGACGLSVGHSLPSLASLLFFCAAIPVFASYGRAASVCTALIAGQSIAALHSFFEAAIPGGLSRLFLGKVTESGQLALTIPIAIGALLVHYQTLQSSRNSSTHSPLYSTTLTGLTLSVFLIALGFNNEAQLSTISVCLLSLGVLTCGALAFARIRNTSIASVRTAIMLGSLQIPLLLCALAVNLKRGPWIGTLVAAMVFCFLHARRFALVVLVAAICAGGLLAPVRERLLASYDHFTISGGRSTIWRIGAELATEYPLGIGYHNSGIMREFAPEIPPELKHFHNNIINITTETGWLGGAVCLWFLVVAIRTCFSRRDSLLYTSIGCALIAWQVAGLVEYNFGDSEITIIVWTLLGLVLQREAATKPLEIRGSAEVTS